MFWLFICAAKYIFAQTTIVNSVRIDCCIPNKSELCEFPSGCYITSCRNPTYLEEIEKLSHYVLSHVLSYNSIIHIHVHGL